MFELKLKEYAREEIPPIEVAAEAAIQLAEDIKTKWSKGSVYNKEKGIKVQTYNQRIGGDFWMARVSKHSASEVSFEAFKRGLLDNHTENEVKYIPLLNSFKELDVDGIPTPWRPILVHYKFPRMFSDREMTVWIGTCQPDPNKKQFVVVSLPADQLVSKDVTRAYYCSCEVVTYHEEEGYVEWLMAQASDACGNIPRWIQERSVTASVVDDVPCFIKWISEQK